MIHGGHRPATGRARRIGSVGVYANSDCVRIGVHYRDLVLLVEHGRRDVAAQSCCAAEGYKVARCAAMRCVCNRNDRGAIGGGKRVGQSDRGADRGDVVVVSAALNVELQIGANADKV